MELKLYDEQLAGALTALKQSIEAFKRSGSDSEKPTSAQMQSIQSLLDSMRLELAAESRPVKREYQGKFRAHKNRFQELKNDLEWAQSDQSAASRDELLDGASPAVVDVDSERGLIAYGRDLNEESKASLTRSLAVVTKTEEVASQVTQTLQQNTERLVGMSNELDRMDGVLDRSKRIIARIGRRVVTDKITWVLIGLIVCLIIVLLVLKHHT